MAAHQMNLADAPFGKIKNGSKRIESRLYDEKRRTIELGDEIEFLSKSGDRVAARVVALLRYPTFEDMFRDFDPSIFGGESIDKLSEEIHKFYSDEDEKRFGVLGIKLRLI